MTSYSSGGRALRLGCLAGTLLLGLLPGGVQMGNARFSAWDPALLRAGGYGPFLAFWAAAVLTVLSVAEWVLGRQWKRGMSLLAYFAFLCAVLPLFRNDMPLTPLCGWGMILLLACTVLLIKGVGRRTENALPQTLSGVSPSGKR